MPRTVRRPFIIGLVALHAAVMLCGAGLHALPGLAHDSGLRPLAKNDHTHGPGKSSHEAAEDCSLCQLLFQSQLAAHQHCAAPAWLAIDSVCLSSPTPELIPAFRTSSPRAPPSLPHLSA